MFDENSINVDGEEISDTDSLIELLEQDGILRDKYTASGPTVYYFGEIIASFGCWENFKPSDIPGLKDETKRLVGKSTANLPEQVRNLLVENKIQPELQFIWHSS